VDLTSGARTVFSNNVIPNSYYPLTYPYAITLDSENNRALVVDNYTDLLLSIDLKDGKRSLLSGSRNLKINTFGMAFDNAHNIALITSEDNQSIIAVDTVTGARVIFSK
jgi:hypothetical protein